ncbi:MAG: hypothetical protein U5R06_14840 [candidate division KSB1 bacterium]|nr:hypothetical protein [candidate division KSB1 bacterium]
MRKTSKWLLLLGFVLFSMPLAAQTSLNSVLQDLSGLTGLSKDTLKTLLKTAELDTAIDSPVSQSGEHPLAVLKDLKLDFKTVDSDLAEHPILAVDYQYEREWQTPFPASRPGRLSDMGMSLFADGSLTPELRNNPENYHNFGISGFYDCSGTILLTGSDTLMADIYNRLEDFAVELVDRETLKNSVPMLLALKTLRSNLPVQRYFRLGGTVGLETSRDFGQKHIYAGTHAFYTINAWNPGSAWAKYNVVDWPFALLRLVNGTDRTFKPSGLAFPGLLAGLDWVYAGKDSVYQVLDAREQFLRTRVLISLKSKISDHSALETCWQVYWQPGAAAVIRKQDMHLHSLLSFVLRLQGGMYISYSTGKLPFDRRADQRYEIGLSYKFK